MSEDAAVIEIGDWKVLLCFAWWERRNERVNVLLFGARIGTSCCCLLLCVREYVSED